MAQRKGKPRGKQTMFSSSHSTLEVSFRIFGEFQLCDLVNICAEYWVSLFPNLTQKMAQRKGKPREKLDVVLHRALKLEVRFSKHKFRIFGEFQLCDLKHLFRRWLRESGKPRGKQTMKFFIAHSTLELCDLVNICAEYWVSLFPNLTQKMAQRKENQEEANDVVLHRALNTRASIGWLKNFKSRPGVQKPQTESESLSDDKNSTHNSAMEWYEQQSECCPIELLLLNIIRDPSAKKRRLQWYSEK
ncbi:hypothetical protein TNCV_2006551 [Trichonephila clavipes]|nr:hypothetical protein TNCV_2006551 [Trichonephila clavipes]